MLLLLMPKPMKQSICEFTRPIVAELETKDTLLILKNIVLWGQQPSRLSAETQSSTRESPTSSSISTRRMPFSGAKAFQLAKETTLEASWLKVPLGSHSDLKL